MSRQGRPLSHEPALAYQYRRAILLVQILAAGGSDEPLRHLCKEWGIEPVEDRSEPPYRGRYYINVWATIIRLAQHALEHGRQQE